MNDFQALVITIGSIIVVAELVIGVYISDKNSMKGRGK